MKAKLYFTTGWLAAAWIACPASAQVATPDPTAGHAPAATQEAQSAPSVSDAPTIPAAVPGAPAPTAATTPVDPAVTQDPSAAAAQSSDREIVVTATRQGQTLLQRTPIAVSAFSQDRLDRSLATNIKDLVQFTPNLNVAQVTASAAIYIRGIGTNAVFNGSDPDVAFYTDGIYLARAFTQFSEFLDVDRVEVLRGPQGTLYGRNAVGGVVNLISRLPTDNFEGRAQLIFGNYGTFQPQAYVSGPIVPGVLQASLAGSYTLHNGYTKNVLQGRPDLGDANRGALRGQLRFHPTDTIDAITRFDYSKLSEHIQAYDVILAPLPYPVPIANSLVGNYHHVAQNDSQTNDQRAFGVSQEINLHFGKTTLRSLTAHRDSRYHVYTDTDASELTINNAQQVDHSKQFSQELNLIGRASIVDYVLGLYYFRENQRSMNEGFIPPSVFTPASRAIVNQALPRTIATSKAAFAQGTAHLTETISVIGGIRYTKDEKQLDLVANRFSYATAPLLGPQVPGFPFIAHLDPKFHAFTPKIGVNWQITPDHFFYASYSKGFKSGGNNFAATSLVGITYRPETLSSYEAGVKTQWFDHRLRMNLTGFYYDYKDLQVQSLIGPGNTQVANAATAKVKGLEFESSARPVDGLELTANLAYLDATYGSFPAATVPGGLRPYLAGDPRFNVAAGTYNATGNRLNAAPKYSASTAAQYSLPVSFGSAYVRGEYYWQSRVYYDPSNVLIASQPSYGLLNLSVGVDSQDKNWSAQLAVKNVTKKDYFITLAGNGAVPSGYAGTPRTVLLRLSRKF